jgi:hypothetical protein
MAQGGRAPAKQAAAATASAGSGRKRDRTPGAARSCCTFFAPASWYATEGHSAASLRSSSSLRPA